MQNPQSWIFPHKSGGVVLLIYVKTKSKQLGFDGLYGEPPRLVLRIKEMPIEGRANQQVQQFLSDYFNTSLNSIELIRGAQSKAKDFWIKHLSLEDVSKSFALSL
jgi:uncharacterized protein YggU (UPF0235/DUF167 family)